MRFTRRELASVLAPTVVAVAQPAAPADEFKAAQARLKAASDALAHAEVPMAVEPAFQFKV